MSFSSKDSVQEGNAYLGQLRHGQAAMDKLMLEATVPSRRGWGGGRGGTGSGVGARVAERVKGLR